MELSFFYLFFFVLAALLFFLCTESVNPGPSLRSKMWSGNKQDRVPLERGRAREGVTPSRKGV